MNSMRRMYFMSHRICFVLLAVLAAQFLTLSAVRADTVPALASLTDIDKLSAVELTALGARHEHAEGVPRDPAKAIALYCAAARQGHADALYALGWMYAHARGTPRDDGLARYCFELAANQGHEQAKEMLRFLSPEASSTAPSCLQPATSSPSDTDMPRPTYPQGPIYQLVHKLAPRYGIDPQLALAIIHVESAFNPRAISPKNARGLMQLTPETARRFQVKDPFNPEDNLKGGLSYLQWLFGHFQGNVPLVLAAYNAGEGAVKNHQGIPPYAETQNYVRKVTFLYGKNFQLTPSGSPLQKLNTKFN